MRRRRLAGECLLHQACGKTIGYKDIFTMLELGFPGFKFTDVVGCVTHTSEHSGDGFFGGDMSTRGCSGQCGWVCGRCRCLVGFHSG